MAAISSPTAMRSFFSKEVTSEESAAKGAEAVVQAEVHTDVSRQEEQRVSGASGTRPKELPKRTEGRREKSSSVCKEFLRGECRRSHRCKYVHPPNFNWKSRQVCYDFTVGKCKPARGKCQFRHVSREEFLREHREKMPEDH